MKMKMQVWMIAIAVRVGYLALYILFNDATNCIHSSLIVHDIILFPFHNIKKDAYHYNPYYDGCRTHVIPSSSIIILYDITI